MKHLLMVAMMLLAAPILMTAQTIKNATYCDITVQAICYDPGMYPGDCSLTPSAPIPVPANSAVTLPSCTPPTVTVAYQVCWHSTYCTSSCVTVDAGSAHFPDCVTPPPPTPPGAPWAWAGVTATTLPPCADCVQPTGGAATVKIDPTTGNIYVGP